MHQERLRSDHFHGEGEVMGQHVDDYVDRIKELEQQRASLVARLAITTNAIQDYLDGTWDGNEEGWRLTMDLNHKAIQALKGKVK